MRLQSKYRIGIIGIGIVGRALESYFRKREFQVFSFDKPKKIGTVVELNNANLIWIAVPTPRAFDDRCDVSIVFEAVEYLEGPKIVIVKSTVPPGTTDKLQAKFPKHKFFHNPEFLTEITSETDFFCPSHQILGWTPQSKYLGQEILKTLPQAINSVLMPASAAEMFKYVRNSFLAVKNAFFNQVFDLCQAYNVDYEFIRRCAEADPWIGAQHLEIWHKGKRGFNGRCLPKDTEAFLKLAQDKRECLSVLFAAVLYNSGSLRAQALAKES